MEASRTTFVAADHSKFNAEAMMPIAHISKIDSFFTDERPPELILNSINQNGTNLFVGLDKI